MRLLVAEFVTAGGLPADEVPPSLAREGFAMFRAVHQDFAALPFVDVVVMETGDAESFEERLLKALVGCDAAFAVAPEFDGILARVRAIVEEVGVEWIGCSAASIALTSDKLRLHDRFRERGIPTIATMAWAPDVASRLEWRGPFVVKPRDGCGSLGIRRRPTPADVEAIGGTGDVVQPFMRGFSLSTMLIVRSADDFDVLPVALQTLDWESLAYEGGAIPAPRTLPPHFESVVRGVVSSIDGLNGCVGIDFVMTDAYDDNRLLVTEINPRLTTSFLGYRQLAEENLVSRLFERHPSPIPWKHEGVRFRADGTILSRVPLEEASR